MLYEIKLRVTRRFLGGARPRGRTDKVWRFRKNEAKEIILDLPRWVWAMKEMNTFPDVDVTCVRLPSTMRSPTLFLFRDKASRMFEAIEPGVVLTFTVFLPKELPPKDTGEQPAKRRPPTPEEFKTILGAVGEHVGLSPWGSEIGLGRFKIESFLSDQSTTPPVIPRGATG
jgi:hypothetical protein